MPWDEAGLVLLGTRLLSFVRKAAKECGKNKVAFRSAKERCFRGATGDKYRSYFPRNPELHPGCLRKLSQVAILRSQICFFRIGGT